MKGLIEKLLKDVLAETGITDIAPEVEIPEDPTHGDYTSNIPLRLSKTLKKPPMDIALQVAEKIKSKISAAKANGVDQNSNQTSQTTSGTISAASVLQDIDHVEIAPPGFINFFLTEAKFINQLSGVLNERERYGTATSGAGKKIMVEFAHPNTHKAFHIGHLRNITTGESIVRLLEATGHKVVRANYQGDVGMHIAKALYALLEIPNLKSQIPDVRKESLSKRVEFLGKAYAAGSKVYEEDEKAKLEIGELNKKIYSKDPAVNNLYLETRQWSLDYFEQIYKRVGTHYDRYYFESEVFESGKRTVLEGLKKGIFQESEGAIIFPGEKYASLAGDDVSKRSLHNRVFITREGNPTYEGKDMGLGPLQFAEYHPDRITHVVGPEQAGYFQVVFEALAQMFPDTRGKEQHYIYGWVKLKHGKMSSRSGVVVLGEWLLDEAKKEIYNILERSRSKDMSSNRHSGLDPESTPSKEGARIGGRNDSLNQDELEEIAEKAAVASVKYSFLRVSPKSEIAFDLKESVSFEGDSGPYLQYVYARAKSVLRKASHQSVDIQGLALNTYNSRNTAKPGNAAKDPDQETSNAITVNSEEKAVLRLIWQFPEVVQQAGANLTPNTLAGYLFQLAQVFNLFYSKHSILGTAKEPKVSNFRIKLTAATAQVIKNGLYLLGIDTLEQM